MNTTTAGVQTDSTVTALIGGGFVVTWTDNSASGADTSGAAIRGQRYDANGVRIGGEFLVNSITANGQTQSSVTALADGGFAVTWTDASLVGGDADGQSVKARIFDANGTAAGGDFLVNTTTKLNQGAPAITSLASGGFVVSWTDASGLGPDTKGASVRAQLYSATGTKIGGEFLVNTTTLNSQNNVVMTGLASGGFVATWTDSSGQGGDPTAPSVKAQLFAANGSKIGGEFLVNTAVAGSQDQPAITSLSNGGFVIVWRDVSLQGDTSGAGVKAQVYDANGAKVGGELLVNTTTVNTQDQPVVVAMPGGGFTVTWHDNSILAADASGFGIKAQVFDNAGTKLGSEVQINTVTGGNQEQPSIAALASGALVVTWTDFSGIGGDADGAVKMQMFAPTAGSVSNLTVSASQLSETSMQNVAVASLSANGAYNAAYSYQLIDDSTGGAFRIEGDKLIVADSQKLDYEVATAATLTIRVSDGFGNSFDKIFDFAIRDAVTERRFAGGDELLVNTAIANNQQQPAAALLASGNSVIAWADASGQGGDASSYGIKLQLLDATGNRVGGEVRVNTQTLNSQDSPSIAALASGGFVVSWTDASGVGGDAASSGIKAQLFDASGGAIGGEFLVNTATGGAQKVSVVAGLASGGFVVTWNDASLQGGDASVSSVKAQVYDAAGNRLGGELLVNTLTPNGQETPVVTGLLSGGFVISWNDRSLLGGDASKDSVKAQLFDAGGAKIGGELLVNTTTVSNQQQESIAALDTGGFVIAWADSSGSGGDPDNFGIKLQVFDASGAKVGGEILANSNVAGAQIAPSVSAMPGGGFVVNWADYGGSGPERGTPGIKGRLFTSDGTVLGDEFIVDTLTRGGQVDPAVIGTAGGGFLTVWTDSSGLGGDDSASSIKAKFFVPLPDQNGPAALIATADTLAGNEDQILVVAPGALTANDTTNTGQPLTIQSVGSVSGGTASLLSDGSVTFTPFADFSGTALFTYVVTDGTAIATGRVTVTIAGVDDAPVAADDAVTLGQNGGTIAKAALLANDRDVDVGDVLTIASIPATSANGIALTLVNGNVVYAPGSAFQSLGAAQTATDSFAYTVADIAGTTATANVTVTITGANDAPLALALSNARVDENAANGTVVGTLAASDVDQGDTLTYSLTDNAGGRFVVDAVTGIVTVANGTLLDYEKATSWTIAGRAVDAGGLAVTATFAIAVNNLPEPKSYTGDNGANVFTASSNDFWTISGLGGNDVLTRNASADTIYGGAGNDQINGAGGADLMYGGIGNDIYTVDNSGDQVIENVGEGTDLINASVDLTLGANIEQLTLTGILNLAAVGNDIANTINGNAGNNSLRGGLGGDLLVGNDGNDQLWGEAGGDFLQGGAGSDLLIGGAGLDDLIGGAGNDVFVFDSLTTSAERDTVRDFVRGEDLLQLASSTFAGVAGSAGGTLAASAFVSGTQATTADHHIVYNASTGFLYYDADGAGGAAMIQIAFFSTRPALTSSDFIVS
ncbi:MAG TPA: Ig-like domain-containing protein [Sphingomonas sp.]|nr:Ig-like domain-containing protein [Sphingomonas sp.]